MQPASSMEGDPSCSSIPSPAQTASTAQIQGKGVIPTNSISQLFKVKDDKHVFAAIFAGIELFDEDIGASLLKYHPVYDPMRDHNPLVEYGAMDGILPGKTSESTISL
jgi:hypothetical protein